MSTWALASWRFSAAISCALPIGAPPSLGANRAELRIEGLQHRAPDHFRVVTILLRPALVHLADRATPAQASIFPHSLNQLGALFENSQCAPQSFIAPPPLLLGERVCRIGVTALTSKAKRTARPELRQPPAA